MRGKHIPLCYVCCCKHMWCIFTIYVCTYVTMYVDNLYQFHNIRTYIQPFTYGYHKRFYLRRWRVIKVLCWVWRIIQTSNIIWHYNPEYLSNLTMAVWPRLTSEAASPPLHSPTRQSLTLAPTAEYRCDAYNDYCTNQLFLCKIPL